jgi:hypothetical protein
VLWLNPFIADADLICGTTAGNDVMCYALSEIRGETINFAQPAVDVAVAKCPPNADCPIDRPLPAAEVGAQAAIDTRDRFWPQSALAFVGIGALLTVVSSQLVAPTRRFRLRRQRRHLQHTTPVPGMEPMP